jgi:hypothetical protein
MEKSNGYPRVEPRGRKAYLKEYVDRPSGEPARLRAETAHAGLSQQRIGVPIALLLQWA